MKELVWEKFENRARVDVENEVKRDNQRLAEIKRQREAEVKRQAELRRQQKAREAAERRSKEIQALRVRLEQQWNAHMNEQFSGRVVINNVGDLLAFNKPRAIGLLSQGVRVRLRTQNLTFQDGTVVISDEHDPTDVFRPVREAELAAQSELARFMTRTQQVGVDFSGPSIRVICKLGSNALSKLDGKSSAIFKATMKNLDTRSAVFDCKLN